ncbi:MAG: 50S ribosomal protein L21 [Spirochaetaceae bacterium]
MYALVEIKGKQYKAETGSLLKVDSLKSEVGTEFEFDTVLMIGGDNSKIGTPYVAGAKVKAVVEHNIKDKKIRVFKYNRRKSYRRTQGHRQQYSLIRVSDILGA